MAYAGVFACQNPTRLFYSGHIAARIIGGSSGWQGLKPRMIQMNNNHMCQREKRTYLLKRQKNFGLIPMFAAESDFIPVVPSVSDVIRRLYTCINEKNLKELEDIISNDCLLEDSTFPHSFQGKKEVVNFFGQLIVSMGENVHFRIGTVCEGGELIASVDWHLEWNDDQLPFSRGCSIFQCCIDDDRLVIRKVQIIIESPFKPGDVGMGLLRILASLFDEFPKAANWFLKSPHTIFMVMSSIYNLLVAPFMNPFLAFYITIWKLLVRLLGYAIRILHFAAKFIINISSNGGDPRS
ncbi:hypothetical protein vseg_016768 [Gypsophila vaccaria]